MYHYNNIQADALIQELQSDSIKKVYEYLQISALSDEKFITIRPCCIKRL